jgi:TetR/AcrR family transcriptional regulator, copper-responsive repressor
VADLEYRIQAAIGTGELPADTDARVLAVFTGAVLQGMSRQARDGMDQAGLAAVASIAMRTWP